MQDFDMPKIHIPQKNLTLVASTEDNLMQFLLSHNIPVASSCHGDGICGKCRLKISGSIKPANHLEQQTLQRNRLDPSLRLSCQITTEQDLTVEASYW